MIVAVELRGNDVWSRWSGSVENLDATIECIAERPYSRKRIFLLLLPVNFLVTLLNLFFFLCFLLL